MKKILRLSLISLFLSFIVMPIAVMLVWVFAVRWAYPNLLPTSFNFSRLSMIISEYKAIQNSLLIGCISSMFSVLSALPVARALAFAKFKHTKLINILILTPVLLPQISGAIALHRAFLWLGLCDTLIGVVLAHAIMSLPYSVRILTDGYIGIGMRNEEPARDLGAHGLTLFRTITLPLLAPAIFAAVSFAFVISLGQYLTTLFVGGGRFITLPLVLFPLIQNGERGAGAAFASVFVLCGILFCSLLGRSMRHQSINFNGNKNYR